ncbi:aftiphilin isoform X2 [Neocloeon triangulifer]|uniref:aftiphilin isoform X2 n=1 Tax=Neocloeon triangulifer TaxID=2078957 RepID=UPI00286F5824|nr:aftiphilin isoform X2 [Neocloeon triangulifer]
MSNLIPPILSTTPPPLPDIPDDDDDFGDFAVADDPFHTDCEVSEPVGGEGIPWSDESLKKSTDRTSQDSVLSANSDSGLCSDSSPLPIIENNCDHQALNCDVPSSEIIPQAQCDLPKTSTNGEIEIASSSDIVNSKDGDLGIQLDDLAVACEHQDVEEKCEISNNLQEPIFIENSGASQFPEVNSLESNFETQTLKDPVTIAESENKFAIDWDSINEEPVNKHVKEVSKEIYNFEPKLPSPEHNDLKNEEDRLSDENIEFSTQPSTACVDFKNEKDWPKRNGICADDEVVSNQDDFEKLEVNCTLSSEAESNQVPLVDNWDGLKTEVENVTEQPPSIQDDIEFDLSTKDEETTESFGSLDERPQSQNSDGFRIFESAKQLSSDINDSATASNAQDDEDFGNFAGFEDSTDFKAFQSEADSDFVAFKEFSSTTAADDNWVMLEENTNNLPTAIEEDDFGDFEEADDQFEFSNPVDDVLDEDTKSESIDFYSQPAKIKEIVESIFDSETQLDLPQALSPLSTHLKHLWPEIQDVQNTPALEFLWNNSKSHDQMLSSLGIDTRNILFGHQWNSSMPRFAANLGHNPLEPTKATDSLLAANSVVQEDSVPAAQFDWNGSGLVNPLDCKGKSEKKSLSAAAQKVLSSLPDLSYMRASNLPHS